MIKIQSNKMRFIHIMHYDKFNEDFISLIEKNFDPNQHLFMVFGELDYRYVINKRDNVIVTRRDYRNIADALADLKSYCEQAETIILHGLFLQIILKFLYEHQAFLPKCCWLVWGGDLYCHQAEIKDLHWQEKEHYRLAVIPKLGRLVTTVPGDFVLAQQWYGAKSIPWSMIFYPAGAVVEYPDIPPNKFPAVMVGNSATAENNHLQAFELLRKFSDHNFTLYCPLSYGDSEYASKVIEAGRSIFSNNFVPLTDYMQLENYLIFLRKVDIAIFMNDRQQALGNILQLLAMGKKLYMKPMVSHTEYLKQLGVTLFDPVDISLETEFAQHAENRIIIYQHYSYQRLISNLHSLFENESGDFNA